MSLSGVVFICFAVPGFVIIDLLRFMVNIFLRTLRRKSFKCHMCHVVFVRCQVSVMKVKRKRIMIVFIIDRESGLKFFVYFYRMSGNNYILLTLLFMKKTVSWRCNIDTYYRKYTFSKKQNPFFHTNSSKTICCCKSKAKWSTKPAHVEIS